MSAAGVHWQAIRSKWTSLRTGSDPQIPLLVRDVCQAKQGGNKPEREENDTEVETASRHDPAQIEILEWRNQVEESQLVRHVCYPRHKICCEQYSCGEDSRHVGQAE